MEHGGVRGVLGVAARVDDHDGAAQSLHLVLHLEDRRLHVVADHAVREVEVEERAVVPGVVHPEGEAQVHRIREEDAGQHEPAHAPRVEGAAPDERRRAQDDHHDEEQLARDGALALHHRVQERGRVADNDQAPRHRDREDIPKVEAGSGPPGERARRQDQGRPIEEVGREADGDPVHPDRRPERLAQEEDRAG